MNAIKMIELRSRTPFVPFDILLTDGKRIRVQEPFQIATRPGSPSCAVYGEDDDLHFVTYRNITEIIPALNEQQ